MDVTVNAGDFTRELAAVLPACSENSPVVVFGSVLLRGEGNELRISCNNMKISIRSQIEGRCWAEGQALIPAKQLHAYVSLLPASADLSIRLLENFWIALRCGRSAAKLNGIDPAFAPKRAEMTGAYSLGSAPAAIVAQAFQRAYVSTTKEETNFSLRCGELKVDGCRATLRSSDGHRLSIVHYTLNSDVKPTCVLVPRKALKVFPELSEGRLDANITATDDHIFLSVGCRTLIASREYGGFPNFEAVIKTCGHSIDALFGVEELRGALSRAALFTTVSRMVRIEFDGLVATIRTADEDGQAVTEEVTLERAVEPMTIGFNSKLLLDFLEQAERPRVEFQLAAADKAGMLIPAGDAANFQYVVMPMRS